MASITEHNERILARMRGAQGQPGTPETDADPRNPNVDKDAEILRLRDLIDALVDALRPFARWSEGFADLDDTHNVVIFFKDGDDRSISVGDLRKALAALEKAEGK